MVLALLSLIGAALGQDVVLLEQAALAEQVRFHQELALTLDAVKLQPAPEAFANAPMATQLEAVRPMLASEERQAVVWLGGDSTKLWVSVAFVDKDRAVIRMIDLPRDPDPLPRLALAVRELVTTAYTTEPSPEVPTAPPPPPPQPSAVWWTGASGGTIVPLSPLAGGPRGEVAAAVHRDLEVAVLGAELVGQIGTHQRRIGLGVIGRRSLLTAGIQAHWIQADWALPVQPRAFVGVWHRWTSGLTAQARVQVHPVRDQVAQADRWLYDTGWTGLGIFVGWERKIPPG